MKKMSWPTGELPPFLTALLSEANYSGFSPPSRNHGKEEAISVLKKKKKDPENIKYLNIKKYSE